MKKQTRREFLQTSAAGLAVLGLSGGDTKGQADQTEMELIEATIAELQTKMRAGNISAVQLVERYTRRIKLIDSRLASVVEINPDAVRIAEKLDKERKNGKIRSAMHGIPADVEDVSKGSAWLKMT